MKIINRNIFHKHLFIVYHKYNKSQFQMNLNLTRYFFYIIFPKFDQSNANRPKSKLIRVNRLKVRDDEFSYPIQNIH